MSKSIFTLFAASLISTSVLAHGGDAPGPNGGQIQMPGNFHTELVRDEDGSFKIYLLDIDFKNPTIKNSEVKLKVTDSNVPVKIKCVTKADHFYCKAPKKLTSGTVTLDVTREGIKAPTPAIYSLK